MSARGVRIVVGEGPSARTGLLRFVLDGEGYDVVAEAATTAELARLMATHRPDIVVLDDGIGAIAVGMINEMSPNTKVVLVWPGAVMPIGGAARVEPSRVLQDLGPAIARLTGQPGASAAGRGAALLDRVTNDPDKLHELLLGGRRAIDEPIIEDREPAPVVILPLTPTIDHSELILNVPDAAPDDDRTGVAGAAAGATGLAAGAAALAGSVPAAAAEGTPSSGGAAATSLAGRRGAVGAQSALNRRLGNLALGGAAVASALVLALALGGARVPIAGVSGAASTSSTPPPVESTATPPPTGDPRPGGENTTPPGEESTGGDAPIAEPFQNIRPVGNEIPEPPGPPEVDIDPGDIGPGGGNDGPPSGGGSDDDGSDDHSGRDSGDHDRGGGNDDPDNGGGGGGDDDDGSDDHDSGGGGGDDDDGSDDHDSGGGNDGDGDDHDNGGGNDDEDNPAHDDDDVEEPGGGNGGGGEGQGQGQDAGADRAEDAGSDHGEGGVAG